MQEGIKGNCGHVFIEEKSGFFSCDILIKCKVEAYLGTSQTSTMEPILASVYRLLAPSVLGVQINGGSCEKERIDKVESVFLF